MNMIACNNFHFKKIPANRSQGFTLVEIMLAITLSLILIAGVVQVYLSSKTSFLMQNQLARIQENERISMDFLQRDISQAGFNIPLGQQKITVTEGANGASDSIIVRYASNTDCLGQATAGIAVNEYFIETDALGNSLNRLMCRGNGNPNVPQPIADGINSMQILLGENSIDNGSTIYAKQLPSADRYVNVGNVANLNQVVSVRLALLIQSEQAIREQNTAQTFTLLDTVVNTNDRTKRQVVTTTVPLRNLGG